MGYSPWGRKKLDTTEATKHCTAHQVKQVIIRASKMHLQVFSQEQVGSMLPLFLIKGWLRGDLWGNGGLPFLVTS